MRRIAITMALVVFTAVAAIAQVPAVDTQWLDGPVKVLVTWEVANDWKNVRSDADAKAFADLFWARRDPTPTTLRNEFREEFEARVAAADKHFTTMKTKGSLSDRGRVLILLGAPYSVSGSGAQTKAGPGMAATATPGQTTGSGEVSVAGPRGEPAKMAWFFANDKKPQFIKRKDFTIQFVDDQGGGDFQLAVTPRSNPEQFLREAVKYYVVSPNMTKVPEYADAVPVPAVPEGPASEFRTASLKEAYDRFKADGKKSFGPAHLTWGEFVTPKAVIFVPVSLYLPASSGIPAGRELTFVGVVENEAGEIVQVHEEAATLKASGADAYFDKSLELAPGKYNASFGLAADGQPLTMVKTELTIRGIDPAESGASDLILSNNAFPLPQVQEITDPFAFGGLKVIPKGDGLFKTSDDIWYFFELRNPGLTESGAPKVMAKIDIEGTSDRGTPVKMNFPIQEFEVIPLKGVANHFGLAMSFPLKDFKPGRYKVRIRVVDTVLKKSYESEKPFDIQL